MSREYDTEQLWQTIKGEVQQFSAREPYLASYFYANVLNHDSLASALSFHIATRLGCDSVPEMTLTEVFDAALADNPEILQAAVADIHAHYERDPACNYYALPVLYFKGFRRCRDTGLRIGSGSRDGNRWPCSCRIVFR